MSFEQALNSSLAAALGDDAVLVAELRAAFLESARRHYAAMRAAESDADWKDAALRLKGLAASFGATELMRQAGQAAAGRRSDAELLDAIERSLAILAI